MAVIKIKKPRDPNETAQNEPKTKKIRIKTKISDNNETKSKTATPKIKISLKKSKDVQAPPKSERSSTTLKVKLNLKSGASSTTEKTKTNRPPRLRLKPIRVPGDGYDSEASDVEDDPLIESGIILRVMPDLQVEFIRNSIESGDYSGINIKWKADRHAVVTINDTMYGAILVDLPTIIEVNKSVDRKNLLKTIDVDQMLLCIQQIDNEDDVFLLTPPDTEDLVSKHFGTIRDEILDNKAALFKAMHGNQLNDIAQKYINQIAQKNYEYKSGITPPLYNVRNRRFRRKMGPSEMEYVENTIEMLLKQDEGSEEVTYELVDPNQILPRTTSSANVITGAEPSSGFDVQAASVEDEDDLDLEAAFQSDEDEAGSHMPAMDEIMENGSAQEQKQQQYSDVEIDNDVEEDDDDDDDDEEDDDDDETGEKDEEKQHTKLLEDELRELESTLAVTKRKSEKATNPLLKSRFLDSIKKLEKEVELKKKQLKSNEDSQKDVETATTEPFETVGSVDPTEENEGDVEADGDDDDDDDDQDDDEPEEEEREETAELAPGDPEEGEELDQNDLDMMMLFGAEGDEPEDTNADGNDDI